MNMQRWRCSQSHFRFNSPHWRIFVKSGIFIQPRPQGFSLKKWKSPGDEVDFYIHNEISKSCLCTFMPTRFSIFHCLLRKIFFFVATAIKTRSHVESQFVDQIYYDDVF